MNLSHRMTLQRRRRAVWDWGPAVGLVLLAASAVLTVGILAAMVLA